MSIRGQIRDALRNGPRAAAAIRQATGLDNISVPLAQMVKEGQLSKDAEGPEGLYTLLEATAGKRTQKESAKGKKKPAKRTAKKPVKRAPKAKPQEPDPRPEPENFLTAMTHDARLVVIENGSPLVFSKAQTLAIADSVLDVYEK